MWEALQGRHPLQTSDAFGAAASQIGPDAQAAATILHTQMGLSHGKVSAVFDTLFGIDLTRGASAQINLRAATRLESDYQLILDDVKTSEQIAADETGWREGGQPAWLHVWVGDRATAYAIDSKRSAAALEQVIGLDWGGILSHDGYATYERFEEAIHQQCVAHVLRRAGSCWSGRARSGALSAASDRVVPGGDSLAESLPVGRSNAGGVGESARGVDERLWKLTYHPRRGEEHERLAQHLWNHRGQWFAFLTDPSIEPTNWKAEQAIRPAVVNRKVWGGNRTKVGSAAPGVLMSVLETCRRQAHSAIDYVSHTLRCARQHSCPAPSWLPTR